MSVLACESQKDSFLQRPISSWLRLDGWMLVAALIMVVAAATRLWDLGSRSYNHDEAIHAWESWRLYTGQGYIYNPVYHGPFLYHATAFIYFLFGHSDYTGRLAAALFGIGTVGIIFPLRPWLKARGTLVAAALVVISPAMMYYGRFIRHDAFSLFFTLVMFVGILNYLERRETKYLYLTVLGQALYLSNMATAFIQLFAFWNFMVVFLLYQRWRDRSRPWREFPAFDLIMVMGVLLAPMASPLAIKAAGFVLRDVRFSAVSYAPEALVRSAIIWAVFFAVAVLIGLWWDRKRFLVSAGIFYAIFAVLYTSFFTNGLGLATGQMGPLGYWLTQHEVRRGGQPWFYYSVVLLLYEYLPFFFALIASGYYLVRRRALATSGGGAQQRAERAPFVPMVLWWAVSNTTVFSWAGEKMPWLVVHLVLPQIILVGWFSEHLLGADWGGLRRRGAGWVGLLLPLALVAVVAAFASRPFGGTSMAALSETMNWLGALVLLGMVGVPLVRYGGEIGWHSMARVATLVVFLGLAVFTARHALMAVFRYGDVAVETLIYAQGTPDPPRVMRELEQMSRRLTGGEKDLKVYYDDESSWPFVWYLRDWPNAHFYGRAPTGPVDAAVVLVGSRNEPGVKPFLGDRYFRRQYRLIWWPIEDYKALTPAKIWQNLTNPEARRSLWNIIMYREYDVPLASWPLVHNFAMYVRKDLAEQLWDYGPEVVGTRAVQAEDPYLLRYQPRMAQRSMSETAGGMTLNEPKGLALDRAGRIYVADSRNHRIQVYGPDGTPIAAWGGQGSGPVQFQEPWGVAAGPGGEVYVADTWNHRIQKLDQEGRFLGQWGVFGEASAPDGAGAVLYGPRGIAVDHQGNVWVTDTGNKRVLKFDPNGVLLGQWGSRGVADGQFLEPVGIAVDGEGRVYVADTWNRRVQVFDATFQYLRQWPVEGWEGQSVVNKPYLAVDADGNVYVTDPETHRVIKYGGQGEVLAVWGRHGSDLSSLSLPTGIAVDAQGRVVVADSGNNRVLEYDPVP